MSETKSINQRENWLSLKRNGKILLIYLQRILGSSGLSKSKVRATLADRCGKRDLANENILCRNRAEVRSKKLCSIDVDEKLRLGRELRQMDREQDKLEAELSGYQEKEVN